MSGYPSIYATVIFDLHPKVKGYLDQLNTSGQIDVDQAGYPYLVRCEKQGPNFFTQISRNNKLENFVLNPRKRVDPIPSWDPNDGFQRQQRKQVMVMQDTGEKPKRERQRRNVAMESIDQIVDGMMEIKENGRND